MYLTTTLARFSLPVANRTVRPLLRRGLGTSNSDRRTFEPDYLDLVLALPPTYPPTNVQMKGYDFHVLESYQGYLHKLCENMGLDVEASWATPCKSVEASTFQLGGTIVNDTYNFNMYERNIQLTNMRSVDAPLLLDVIQSSLPEGVSVSVHPHTEEHYEARFIPDPFVEGLKSELRDIELKKASDQELAAIKKEERAAKKKETLLATLEDFDED